MNGASMSRTFTTRRLAAVCATVLVSLAIPSAASAGPAGAADPDQAPHVALFPSNALTVRDFTQLTGRRMHLPMPDCATNPTDCNTVAELNQLDGFDIDPRI